MWNRYLLYFILLYSFVISVVFIYFNLEASPFLGDQIDQFQNASYLFRGRLKSLYGPYLSTTQPIVYPIGPFIYFIISALKLISNHPFWIHMGFGILNTLALVYTCYFLFKISKNISFIYLLLSLTSFVYWFSLSILWSNVILYSLSSLMLVSYLRFLRRKNVENLLILFLFFILSLHLHLISIVFFPLFIYSFTLFDFKINNLYRFRFYSILIGISLLPYAYAEIIRKFANTKAILFNLGEKSLQDGLRTAEILFSLYLFPLTDSYYEMSDFILFCLALLLIAIIIFFLYLHRRHKYFIRPILISTLIILLFIFLFYLRIGQSYRSLHYFMIFLPFSLLLLSYVVNQILNFIKFFFPFRDTYTIPIVSLIFILFPLYSFQKNILPSDKWNFENTKRSLQSICEKYPNVDSFEWNEFRSPESQFDPVLKYIIREYRIECNYKENAQILLYPDRNDNFPKEFQNPITQVRYLLLEIVEPGIGIYSMERNLKK